MNNGEQTAANTAKDKLFAEPCERRTWGKDIMKTKTLALRHKAAITFLEREGG
jgi:hypothetical protein